MIEKDQVYKHSKKGTLYKIIGTGKHTETLEDLVIYECLYDNKISKLWCRPSSMFNDTVELNGAKVKRFQLIEK